MKPGAVTKLERRNGSITKNFNDDVMSARCSVTFFGKKTYGKITDIRRPDLGRMVHKLTFSSIITFYLKEAENITQKTATRL